jgi:hypothetical protein
MFINEARPPSHILWLCREDHDLHEWVWFGEPKELLIIVNRLSGLRRTLPRLDPTVHPLSPSH